MDDKGTYILHNLSSEDVRSIVHMELQSVRDHLACLEAELKLIKSLKGEENKIENRLSNLELDMNFMKRVVSKM